MGDVINMNRFRKAKASEAAEKQAAENRIRYGKTGAEKKRDKAEERIFEKRHEGHRLTRDDPPEGA